MKKMLSIFILAIFLFSMIPLTFAAYGDAGVTTKVGAGKMKVDTKKLTALNPQKVELKVSGVVANPRSPKAVALLRERQGRIQERTQRREELRTNVREFRQLCKDDTDTTKCRDLHTRVVMELDQLVTRLESVLTTLERRLGSDDARVQEIKTLVSGAKTHLNAGEVREAKQDLRQALSMVKALVQSEQKEIRRFRHIDGETNVRLLAKLRAIRARADLSAEQRQLVDRALERASDENADVAEVRASLEAVVASTGTETVATTTE